MHGIRNKNLNKWHERNWVFGEVEMGTEEFYLIQIDDHICETLYAL